MQASYFVRKNAPQIAIMQLGPAVENFFAGRLRCPQFRMKEQVVPADRSFPSSKLRSGCGYRLGELGHNVRHWTCARVAGASHDRDVQGETSSGEAGIQLKS